jgi:hypothetical protein
MLYAAVLLVTNGLYNSALLALIQAIQLLHIVLIQLKAVDVGITFNSGRRVALRERHESLLQAPPYKNLIGRRLMLLRYADES